MVDRGKPNIEAAKDGVDEHCEFTPSIGDIVSPVFEIIKVDFDKGPDLTETPVVVKEDSYTNRSSVEQKHTFSLSWTKSVSETTSWSHTWGLNTSLSFEFSFVNMTVEITYSGSYGTSSTKERSITISEQTEVTIPPKTKIIAKLFIKKNENCSIPFSATIKKIKADGEESIFTENGIWKGVIYENVTLNLEEEKL
ncbi:aerolysin-like protein [Scleropages formosus]|nr:aerolysin-like protein [Scleropages formosus]